MNNNYDTLVEAMNALNEKGYSEDFVAEDSCIRAQFSNREYQPADLLITAIYRFEGITNPSDQTELFAIEAEDGLLGTMVLSYSAEHSQNEDLIRKIPISK